MAGTEPCLLVHDSVFIFRCKLSLYAFLKSLIFHIYNFPSSSLSISLLTPTYLTGAYKSETACPILPEYDLRSLKCLTIQGPRDSWLWLIFQGN